MKIEVENSNMFYEMANVAKQDSGLPYTLWIDSSGSARNTKHNSPRVKILADNKTISISISLEPKVLNKGINEKDIVKFNQVKKFIVKHYDTLMKHWNQEITDREALNLLVK